MSKRSDYMVTRLLLLALCSLLFASDCALAQTIVSTTQLSYDPVGRVKCKVVRMDPAQWSTQSDACVPQTTSSNGSDRVEQNVYDAAGQLVQVLRGVGTPLQQAYATYAYSQNGKQTDMVDANGNHAQFTYDGLNRQTKWTFPSSAKASAYNSSLSVAGTQPAASTYYCPYDYPYSKDLGPGSTFALSGSSCTITSYKFSYGSTWTASQISTAIASCTTSGGYIWNDTYTPGSNWCATTSTTAASVKYSCPAQYYLVNTTCNLPTALATANAPNANDYESYSYDLNDNRTSLRKRDSSVITLSYDKLNRVLVKTVPERAGLAATHTRDVYYSYDLGGLTTGVKFDSATGEGISTSYDGLGRVSTSTMAIDATTRTFSNLFDANGNRTRVTYPDANFVTYAYDGLNRPTTILRSGTGTVASYAYNGIGQRTAFNSALTTSYGYEASGRLSTLANNLPATSYNNQYSFAYNPASQITQITRTNDTFAWTGSVNVDRVYTANGLNQYTAAGTAAFCYDSNGNLTADGGSVYLYDVENRLVEKRVQGTGNTNCAALSYTGALQAGLRYDPLGRLYEVTGSSGTTRMLYEGDALTAEYDTAGTLLRRYIHGADLKADDPIAWYEGSAFTSANERIMRPDWQGSIVLVADSGGATGLLVNRYDEYGIPQSTNAGRFQYTGQAWLTELGMYYYKARIYSATLGRFLQTDPIGYDDQVNLYAYVANDPVNGTDPDGQRTFVRNGQIYIIPERGNTPAVRVPNSVGARGVSASDIFFHTYEVSTASRNTDRAMVGSAIQGKPTPGPGNRPATPSGTLNNAGAIPTAGSTNLVRSFSIPSPDASKYTDITVNYTISGQHGLNEGFVMRYGEIGSNGGITVQTYGEGNAWQQAPILEGIWGPQVDSTWKGVDQKVLRSACNPKTKGPC